MLHEIKKVERLEVTLAEDEIAYRRNAGDVDSPTGPQVPKVHPQTSQICP